MTSHRRAKKPLEAVAITTLKRLIPPPRQPQTTTYLIDTNIGTTGTKTVLTDTDGKVHTSTHQEHDVLNPHQSWAEQ